MVTTSTLPVKGPFASIIALFVFGSSEAALADLYSLLDLLDDSAVVAVVVLESEPSTEGQQIGCPAPYTGTVKTPVKGSAKGERIEFLSNGWLTVENPYLLFLSHIDVDSYYARERGPFGPCSPGEFVFEIASMDGTQYGAQAAFERRYLTAAELEVVQSDSDQPYFVGHGSAIALFMHDLDLLGVELRDKDGNLTTMIPALLDWHMLQENLGPKVKKSSMAIESDGFLDLLQAE